MSQLITLKMTNHSDESFLLSDIEIQANAETIVEVSRIKADQIVGATAQLPITVEIIGSEATQETSSLAQLVTYSKQLEDELSLKNNEIESLNDEVAKLTIRVNFLETQLVQVLPTGEDESSLAVEEKTEKKTSKIKTKGGK